MIQCFLTDILALNFSAAFRTVRTGSVFGTSLEGILESGVDNDDFAEDEDFDEEDDDDDDDFDDDNDDDNVTDEDVFTDEECSFKFKCFRFLQNAQRKICQFSLKNGSY